MSKAGGLVSLAALLLLLVSFLPWPASGGAMAQPPTPAPTPAPTQAPEVVGQALFRAKGCVTCHRHDGVEGESGVVSIGPELTNYEPNPEFVREWLRDPPAVRPGTLMPDLELSEGEIEALIAFLAD